MHRVAIVAVWLVATAAALVVVWRWSFGSVFLVIGDGSGFHGIHTGDVAAFVVAWAWAAVATVALRPERR